MTDRAVAALGDGREVFTRAQVAYLMALAYDSGRIDTHRAGIAEIYCARDDMPALRETWELQVARRLREIEGSAAREARWRARQPKHIRQPLDGVDWPAVARPGSGRPTDRYADCPCPRTGRRTEDHPSGHVTGWTPDTARRAA